MKLLRWLRSRPLARVRRNLATEKRIREHLQAEASALYPDEIGEYMGVRFIGYNVAQALGIPTKIVPPGVRIVDTEQMARIDRDGRDNI